MLRQFEHIAVRVRNLEESIAFYQEILGFRLREIVNEPSENLRVAFVGLERVELELLDFEGEDPIKMAPESNSVIPHIAFRVDNCEEAYEALKKKGVNFRAGFPKKVLGDRYLIAFFDGPNGESLEILQRL